eukprot:Platyproteum_vivax@DN3621_c0_g1_i1.p1
MRGVIDLQCSVTGGTEPLHSGVHGGAVVEPLQDLLSLTAGLVDSKGAVQIENFQENTRKLDDEEISRLKQCVSGFNYSTYQTNVAGAGLHSESNLDLLQRRWCTAAISVTGVSTRREYNNNEEKSGSEIPLLDANCNINRVIPCSATCNVSIRYVPDQTADDLIQHFKQHLKNKFVSRESPNQLKVTVQSIGPWWEGDPNSVAFQSAKRAVEEVWGVEAMLVREGGTMPVASLLEKALGTKMVTVQIPLGQASDSAHLANERLRLSNLVKGAEVVKKTILYIK